MRPAQTPPSGGEKSPVADVTDLVNALLGGLLGGPEVTGERLQEEVAEAGGLPFREKVEVAFLGREELGAYLRELFDSEYPVALARTDERLLQAFDLLPPGTDLRALRARVLEENVAGFYDERPGKRRLYAVSEDRSFSPMNQVVLVHELRHAQQDQYQSLDGFLDDDVSDFDDRRLAWTSLLEGDATLVMERFVRLRLGSLGRRRGSAGRGRPGDAGDARPLRRPRRATGGPGPARAAVPRGADVRARPVVAWGRRERSARRGGGRRSPPSRSCTRRSSSRERRRASWRRRLPAPRGARLLSEGVLGEMLLRTLVEGAGEAATEGWGGDGWRLWDVRGRTALAWRSEWDSAGDAGEFHAALRAALRAARRGCLAWGLGDLPGHGRATLRAAPGGGRGRAAVRRRRGALRADGRGGRASRLKLAGGKARVPLQPAGLFGPSTG